MAATTEDRAYSGLPNKAVSAADGIDYAYRDTGGEAGGTLPLVLFQHFRGNVRSSFQIPYGVWIMLVRA
jgi:hypothetical protein